MTSLIKPKDPKWLTVVHSEIAKRLEAANLNVVPSQVDRMARIISFLESYPDFDFTVTDIHRKLNKREDDSISRVVLAVRRLEKIGYVKKIKDSGTRTTYQMWHYKIFKIDNWKEVMKIEERT